MANMNVPSIFAVCAIERCHAEVPTYPCSLIPSVLYDDDDDEAIMDNFLSIPPDRHLKQIFCVFGLGWCTQAQMWVHDCCTGSICYSKIRFDAKSSWFSVSLRIGILLRLNPSVYGGFFNERKTE